MELVDGATLADRLEAGPMALDELLPVFRQIADALDAAHDRGIVHRDLKPHNLKLRPDGTVKVLDFGLAKSAEPASSSPPSHPAFSPTLTTPATAAGMILGTAAYMSPEQARGKAVDKRSDIWAFGVLLFECLTGTRLFDGETVTDTLAAVLRSEIDWSRLPPGVPLSLRNLLRRCLERDARNRLHDIADARIVLDELLSGGHEGEAGAAPTPSGAIARPGAWLAGTFALGVLAGVLGMRFAAPADPGRIAAAPVSFRQLTTLPGGEGDPAVAPDGDSFAYVKFVDGQADIFVQRVDGQNPILLTKSCREDDINPAFSPDGRFIAFHSECEGGGLFVMGATGESVRKVTDFGFDPAWSPDGRDLAVVTERSGLPWARTSQSELWAVSLATGERRRITEHDAMHPSWSPDGRRIAFWGLRGETSDRDIWSVASDGSELRADAAVEITSDRDLDWNPVWSADGSSVYFSSTRGGTMNVWRRAVDPASGRPSGEPVAVTAPSSWVGWLSLSRDGRRLVFVDRNARTTLQRAPFDAERGALDGPPAAVPLGTIEVYDYFDLSADGSSVLFSDSGLPQHLFLARVDGSEVRQLTDGEYRDRQATFSPDERWIAFQTTRGTSNLAVMRPDGSGLQQLASGRTDGWFPVWSPDGTRLAVSSSGGAYLIDFDPSATSQTVVALPAPTDGLNFSPQAWFPDGRELIGLLMDREGVRREAAVYSIPEASYRALAIAPRGLSLLPGGRRLVAWYPGRLVLHDLGSGRAHDVVTATPGRRIVAVALSPDGKWIAWLETADESDIWLAESGGSTTR
jgi:Tol biopolymer transport system component